MVTLRRHRRGVVLVDVLVGAVLVGLALVAINSAIAHALARQNDGEHLEIAAMLADEQLNLVLLRGPDSYSSRYPVRGMCEAPFERFRYMVEFSGGEAGDAYVVRAVVLWSTSAGERNVAIETRIAPRSDTEEFPDRTPEQTVERDML